MITGVVCLFAERRELRRIADRCGGLESYEINWWLELTGGGRELLWAGVGVAGGPGFQELFFAVDQCVDVVRGQIDRVAMCDGISGTSFDAVAAEDAAGIVDVVDVGVAFARGDALGVSIFRSFDVDTIRGAGRRAQEATDALFKAVFVALQDVDATVPGLDAGRDVRVSLCGGLLEHGAERDGEAFGQRHEDRAYFANERWHLHSL